MTTRQLLAQARKLLRVAQKSLEHRKELVQARDLAKQIAHDTSATDLQRIDALKCYAETWQIEMDLDGELGDRAFHKAEAARQDVVTHAKQAFGDQSWEHATALSELAELHIDRGAQLSWASRAAAQRAYQRARETAKSAIDIYKACGEPAAAQELEEFIRERART